MSYLLVGIGGVMGAICRYLIGKLIMSRTGGGFPTGTLVINISGAFVLSLILNGILRSSLEPQLLLALTTGFLGAYTTFSTFSYEVFQLLQESEYIPAAGYLLATATLGLMAAWIGKLVANI
ncbi:MAG: fluoride efflux transporter CrcB [Bacillota bacterium]